MNFLKSKRTIAKLEAYSDFANSYGVWLFMIFLSASMLALMIYGAYTKWDSPEFTTFHVYTLALLIIVILACLFTALVELVSELYRNQAIH